MCFAQFLEIREAVDDEMWVLCLEIRDVIVGEWSIVIVDDDLNLCRGYQR